MDEDIHEAPQDKGSHEPIRKQNVIGIPVVHQIASADNEADDGHSIIKSPTDNQSLLCPQTSGSRRLSEDSDYCSSRNTSRSSLCYSLSHQGSSASLRSIESGIDSMPPSIPSIQEEDAQDTAILKSTESESTHTATDWTVHINKCN